MIIGSFEQGTGRPYLSLKLYFPRLKIQSDVSFLMDTGADTSILMPTDARMIGVNFGDLVGDSKSGGIGGNVHSYVEQAVFTFEDSDRRLMYYMIQLDILHPDPGTDDLPSLLGRDILDCWYVMYDPQKRSLSASVRSADAMRDLQTNLITAPFLDV